MSDMAQGIIYQNLKSAGSMTTCPRQDRKRRREVSPLFSVGVGGVGELDEDDETKLNLHGQRPHTGDLAGLGPLRASYIWAEMSFNLILVVRKPLQKVLSV